MMRILGLLLLLSLAVAAEPRVKRHSGSYTPGRAVTVRGELWRGEVEFRPEKDLRDCAMISLRLRLVNQAKQPACLAIYVALLDSQGKLLAAEGHEESAFLKAPGASVEHRIDLALPQALQKKVATYQITLMEDTQKLK